MPKRHQREPKRHLSEENLTSQINSEKFDHRFVLEIVVGSSNVKRWNRLKITLSYSTDEDFATFLLDLAEQHFKEKQKTLTTSILPQSPELPKVLKDSDASVIKKRQAKIKENDTRSSQISRKRNHNKCKKAKTKREAVKIRKKIEASVDEQVHDEDNLTTNVVQNYDNGKENEVVDEFKNVTVATLNEDIKIETILDNTSVAEENSTVVVKDDENKSRKCRRKNETNCADGDVAKNIGNESYLPDKPKKRVSVYDIRKAPELNEQIDPSLDSSHSQANDSKPEVQNRVAIKIKLCCICGTRHIQDHCPLQNPDYIVQDSITYGEFLETFNVTNEKKETDSEVDLGGELLNEEDVGRTYAYMSLPSCLCLNDLNTSDGLSVFASVEIKQYTQFGPLLGKLVKEVDIPEDFNMKQLWEIYADKIRVYVNTENVNEANWIRFVRPSPTRDERNVIALSRSSQLFLISIKSILAGEELLYWQDDLINVNKKKMEKTSCGGCNITFSHPLYYRTHCSIFHDMRYSLTIRKYHCKVCGAAVLGKENIMKHAAELHNGQGAYQCQFCKKFFLRLNYLEMHRTYGCSANPHRSRPLCDFCGRKFCQPQKLKVHIKRMHSDLSEVLKEFQCKSCLKLLGSRAALQRHMKEVHNKQINGSCACNRCGKLFQNKSNLKIHMLTHSGIKPFRCNEGTCNAAFTTKQCLQFHYKKVHGFTDDRMPKIKRSVDYTFEAYSGDRDQELEDQDGDPDKSVDYNSETNFVSGNTGSDDDSNMEVKDRPPALNSPTPITTELSSISNQSPPTLEPYTNLKILSKGSKKWLGEESLPTLKTDIYHLAPTRTNKNDNSDISLEVDETQPYMPTKLNMNLNSYGRHESSNASLLVEAALDSVTDIHCSESNININVDSVSSGTDVLVNNLCTLTHPETLTDVSYTHSVDIGESRDINLISPSVNAPISVTDGENIRIDYSSFHHNDFSPANSPDLHHRSSFSRDYIDVGQVSPHNVQNYTKTSQSKNISPDSSPPRYNFGHGIGTEHISSDDSNGIGAQNLSLHDSKNDTQLDLSIYKSPYNLDLGSFQFRKDFGMKFTSEAERKMYVLEFNETSKIYHETTSDNNLASESSDRDQVEDFDSSICNKDFENIDDDDLKHKNSELKTKYHDVDQLSSDIRNKQFELDLNLRTKNYEVTNRSSYDGVVDVDFRLKNYDSVENTESRNNLPESEFRIDRNFEPLVLNSTELQGLDMTARSYHNYHSSPTVQNLNRYHHIYPDVDRPSVDLRLNYSPPLPSYTHADVLRVVSLDLTSPRRHSVDLSLRSNPLHVHQLGNPRLLSDHNMQTNRILTDHNRLTLDQSRLLTSDPARLLSSDLAANRHLNSNSRLLSVSEAGNRVLSDHSTNRLLSNEQLSNHLISPEPGRLISDDSRLIADQPRILEQSRLLTESRILSVSGGGGSISPLPYSNYSVSPTPYHPTALTSRSHTNSPTPPYHHYSNYY